jgi:hypothetical protein
MSCRCRRCGTRLDSTYRCTRKKIVEIWRKERRRTEPERQEKDLLSGSPSPCLIDSLLLKH